MSNNVEQTKQSKSKPKSSSHTTTVTSDPLALAKALNNVKKNQDNFMQSVTKFDTDVKTMFEDLEMQIGSKRKAAESLDEEYRQFRNSKRIALEQDLKEYGYTEAVKLLVERKEVAVSELEWNRMKTELESWQKGHAKDVKSMAEEENKKYLKELEVYAKTTELQHKADLAKMTARIDQLTDHIKVLNAQIESQKVDIDKQRELTKAVSEACRPTNFYPSLSSSGSRN